MANTLNEGSPEKASSELKGPEKQQRIAEIKAEVDEIRNSHAQEDADYIAKSEAKYSAMFKAIVEVDRLETGAKRDIDGFISIEHSVLKKRIVTLDNEVKSLFDIHQSNTEIYNIRLSVLHQEFTNLINE